MTRKQAQRFCDEVNGFKSHYMADVVDITNRHLPGGGCALVVHHRPSGNEVGYATTADEARYMVDGIRRRVPAKS